MKYVSRLICFNWLRYRISPRCTYRLKTESRAQPYPQASWCRPRTGIGKGQISWGCPKWKGPCGLPRYWTWPWSPWERRARWKSCLRKLWENTDFTIRHSAKFGLPGNHGKVIILSWYKTVLPDASGPLCCWGCPLHSASLQHLELFLLKYSNRISLLFLFHKYSVITYLKHVKVEDGCPDMTWHDIQCA